MYKESLHGGTAFHPVKFHYMEKGKWEQSHPTHYSELNGLCYKRHTCRNPMEIPEHRFLWFKLPVVSPQKAVHSSVLALCFTRARYQEQKQRK